MLLNYYKTYNMRLCPRYQNIIYLPIYLRYIIINIAYLNRREWLKLYDFHFLSSTMCINFNIRDMSRMYYILI